jgi:hypothetical protein
VLLFCHRSGQTVVKNLPCAARSIPKISWKNWTIRS